MKGVFIMSKKLHTHESRFFGRCHELTRKPNNSAECHDQLTTLCVLSKHANSYNCTYDRSDSRRCDHILQLYCSFKAVGN